MLVQITIIWSITISTLIITDISTIIIDIHHNQHIIKHHLSSSRYYPQFHHHHLPSSTHQSTTIIIIITYHHQRINHHHQPPSLSSSSLTIIEMVWRWWSHDVPNELAFYTRVMFIMKLLHCDGVVTFSIGLGYCLSELDTCSGGINDRNGYNNDTMIVMMILKMIVMLIIVIAYLASPSLAETQWHY